MRGIATILVAAVTANFVILQHLDMSRTAAEAQQSDRHCVIAATGMRDGVLVTEPEACFTTTAEADALVASLTIEVTQPRGLSQLIGANIIGTHFTDTSYGGSSVQIVGTTCGGGVWFATGFWSNNIESSLHHCGASPTAFHDYTSCAGTPYRIYGAVTSLGWMNNRTSCVRYG